MELKINGKVKVVMEQQSWDSGFTKREFVITTAEQYPQDVKLECIKDKTSLLDGLSEVHQELLLFCTLQHNKPTRARRVYNNRFALV